MLFIIQWILCLLGYAREGGLKYSNGLSMLVWQAAIAEEIWNNVKFSKEDIEKVMEITRKGASKKWIILFYVALWGQEKQL